MSGLATLHWPLYLAALALTAGGAAALWLPGAGSRLRLGALGAGLLAATAAIAGRWLLTGRPPVLGTFENASVAAWMLTVAAITLYAVGPFAGRASLSRLVAPWAPLVLAYGTLFRREPMPLEAAGRSLVGYSHAFIGWAGFAILLAASMAALGMLLSRRTEDAVAWDQAVSRLAGGGFAFLTATMATGAVYSFMLFSDWYRWQVVEAFAAASWMAYGLVLHSRFMFGWRGRPLAWSALAALPLMLGAFWLWSVYPDTYHYFERVLASR